MAKLLNKDPSAYAGERDRFLKELKSFHDSKGTPFRNFPSINGKDIDLYQLYWLVTAHGGFEKVNSRNGWEELVDLFNIDEGTTNGPLAIKHIYLRYLDPYEKFHFLGDDDDNDGDHYDEEDSRARRNKSSRVTASVPLVYNHAQHQVPEHHRGTLNLSTDLHRRTDYDRLLLSLSSPLPNEHDFAVNVCTLLSNEGRHTLRLAKCPRLLDHLLSHAGVFNHESLRVFLNALYVSVRGYDLIRFWGDVCKSADTKRLLFAENASYFDGDGTEKVVCVAGDVPSELRSAVEAGEAASGDGGDASHAAGGGDSDPLRPAATGLERLRALKSKAEREVAAEQTRADAADATELFAVGRSSGTRELTGQRVLQIATIVRNLSFEEDNALVLARNLTCLRFCLLCANSSWSNLNQLGFDILSNVASCVRLEEPTEDAVTEALLQTLARCVASPDRFQVISSLDVLNKLCAEESNEKHIGSVLQASIYAQLVTYLSLHDIHLLISTLECLYSLSCLGESPCSSIVRTQGAIEALISLMSVEAQSYGPKACILMRVVETVPGTAQQQQQQQQLRAAAAAAAATSVTVTTSVTSSRIAKAWRSSSLSSSPCRFSSIKSSQRASPAKR